MLPFLIIIASYSYIWFYFWKNKNKFKRASEDEQTKKNIGKQIIRTTMTLFLVCSSNFILIIPRFVSNTLYELEIYHGNSYGYLVIYFFYWIHYAHNFFIYAVRSEQYRHAYLYFLRVVST